MKTTDALEIFGDKCLIIIKYLREKRKWEEYKPINVRYYPIGYEFDFNISGVQISIEDNFGEAIKYFNAPLYILDEIKESDIYEALNLYFSKIDEEVKKQAEEILAAEIERLKNADKFVKMNPIEHEEYNKWKEIKSKNLIEPPPIIIAEGVKLRKPFEY